MSDDDGRLVGEVKFFLVDKGYGFITCSSLGKDVFVHVKSLVGTKTVDKGAQVSFKLADHERGLRAADVQVVGAS